MIESIDPSSDASPYSPAVVARFDIIGMDPRGVGDSGAVRCLTDEQRADVAAADLDPTVPGGKPLPELLADATTFHRRLPDAPEPGVAGEPVHRQRRPRHGPGPRCAR